MPETETTALWIGDLPDDGMPPEWAGMYPFDAGYERNPVHRRRAEILVSQLSRFRPGRLADLGCGNGWFARIAARHGWQVTATDARRRPWPRDENIVWRTGDVRDAPLDGFDVIVMMGIFYHLNLLAQLDLLRRCGGTPLIIDTHLSVDGPEWAGHYRGEVYEETGTIHSAYGNAGSWWPTVGSMLQMLEDAGGYRSVAVLSPWYQPDRTFLTCLP